MSLQAKQSTYEHIISRFELLRDVDRNVSRRSYLLDCEPNRVGNRQMQGKNTALKKSLNRNRLSCCLL